MESSPQAPSPLVPGAKIALAFAAGLVVGAGAMWLGGRLPEETGGSVLPETGVSGIVTAGGNAIYVADQEPGIVVAVGKIVLASPGWVVIREDRGGEPGNILGARRFDAGEGRGEVELLRGTVEGGIYYAILHGDDGDRSFDYTADLPLRDQQGNVISMKFRAGAPADE